MISCKSVRRGQPRGAKLRIHVAVQPAAMPITPRVREACHQFGITPRADSTVIVEDLAIPLQPGQILLVTGPSGCGKSRTLSCIADQLGKRAIWVSRRRPDPKSAIIDQVAPDRPLAEAISILTSCGLGEPRLWLRRHADLSDGEQFRLKLAMSVAEAQQKRPWWQTTPVLIVDEFCAILHRRLAKALSYNLRKLITSSGLCLVAATTHDDLQNDLQPDVHLIPRGSQVFYHAPQPRPFSIDLHITPGRVSDYQHFEAMHYRQREGLGPVDKIFVLRELKRGRTSGSSSLRLSAPVPPLAQRLYW